MVSQKQIRAIKAKGKIQQKKQGDPNDIQHVKAKLNAITLKNSISNQEARERHEKMVKQSEKDMKEFLANKDKMIGIITKERRMVK